MLMTWKIKKIKKMGLFKIYHLILNSLMDIIHLSKIGMVNKKWKWMSQKSLQYYLWAIEFKPKYLNQILCKHYLVDCEKLCFLLIRLDI